MASRTTTQSSPAAHTRRRIGAILVAAALVAAMPAAAFAAAEQANFDARTAGNAGFRQAPQPSQTGALAVLGAQQPDLMVEFDAATGVTRSLYNASGFLGQADLRAGDPGTAALNFLHGQLAALGLDPEDLADAEVTNQVDTEMSGTTNLYLRQRYLGIPVYNGQLQVNLLSDGRVLGVHNAFLPGLWSAINSTEPLIAAAAAVATAAGQIKLDPGAMPKVVSRAGGPQQATTVAVAGLPGSPVEARLMWLPVRAGEARLVWNFQLPTADSQHHYDFTVDAVTGQVWTRIDWVSHATYKVYARPIESPNHTSPLPPSDARTVLTNPHNATASPQGWHSTGSTSWTVHRGNNVHAYDDRDNNGLPPATEPNCGATLACNFAINLGGAPSTYTSAAVTNLFYWNNVIHDVQYQYGFNEAAGNFQVNNFGKGGAGNDDVKAEAQDGSGTNNANFLTPPDGQRPRMQMYEWTNANPDRDSDLDNLVIVHEYGHGISNRLVGGPSNVSCLGNPQQMGEGWSDWLGLVYTAKAGDVGTAGRGVGTYLINQGTGGLGIRTQRYSTSQTVNNWTYASISGMAVPHGVGSVWAQALWEVYWKLVGKYGFDANLYNAGGGKGNQRAMQYITQGMKNTACSPTFLNARDGIIQAATSLNGGADVCLLWEAFAGFGLGVNATTPGPNSTSATNGFQIPTACAVLPACTASTQCIYSGGHTISCSSPVPNTCFVEPNSAVSCNGVWTFCGPEIPPGP